MGDINSGPGTWASTVELSVKIPVEIQGCSNAGFWCRGQYLRLLVLILPCHVSFQLLPEALWTLVLFVVAQALLVVPDTFERGGSVLKGDRSRATCMPRSQGTPRTGRWDDLDTQAPFSALLFPSCLSCLVCEMGPGQRGV